MGKAAMDGTKRTSGGASFAVFPMTSARALVLSWGALRLPLIFFVLYVLKRQFTAAMLKVIGEERATLFVLNLLSTPLSRAFCLAVIAIVLIFGAFLLRRCSPTMAYIGLLVLGALLIVPAILITSRAWYFAIPPLLLLATNLMPDSLYHRLFPSHVSQSTLMVGGVGVSESFFALRHVQWLVGLASGQTARHEASSGVGAIPGIVIAAVATAMLVNGSAVVPLEQAMRMPANVRIMVKDTDLNWIQLDSSARYLYASGHGLNHLRRYDVADWKSPPLESKVPTGNAQGFAYDPLSEELYVYNDRTSTLLYFDARTLGLKRSVKVENIAPGDKWLSVNAETRTITISSEADEEIGAAFVVVDRSTGAVVDRNGDDAGSLLPHPKKSIEYLNYFRRRSGVELYDLKLHKVTERTPFSQHADRMAIWERANELLITQPIEAQIARLDAGTLESKGTFRAIFGVRAIAIDQASNILLCGSLATGKLEMIDLLTGRKVASYYLGPWLRTIELAPRRGIAYVSSNGSLFEVHYK